jgi:lipoprotein-anchoring transpeptidase ErfK/SrfK
MRPPVRHSVYGAYAYGLSGFSNVLTDWEGGGIIGVHGTNDPSSIGIRSSHGCIRMYNRDIKRLVRILPLGTPIEIL